MPMKLLVHASGFRRRYRSDPEELRCGKPREVRGNPDCTWFPSTLDLEALGRSSGGSKPAGTIADLVATIRAQAPDSIEELRIVGHANGTFFALGGTDLGDKLQFTENTMIGDSLTFISSRSAFRSLQDRFRSDGRIVLAGCGSGGVGSRLLELVSHTFLRTIAGFSEPILYAIDGTTRGPMVKDRNGRMIGRRIDDDARITLRGKVMYSKAANKIEDLFGSDLLGTAALRTNAWELQPDAQSKVGDIFDAVRRCKSSPDVISAAEVGFRMKDEFYPTLGQVAGMGFAGDLSGIRVNEDRSMKGKMTIDLGKGFIDRITPVALEQRVRELGAAIDMTAQHRTGIVPAA
jgi:hypothetical protein